MYIQGEVIMKSRWYKDATIYQVYPRSFKDTNNDGIGDIKGIIEKLDYLKDLGIRAVWLSPCYKSPNDDNGYDISDYRDIMEEFGTLTDFKLMLDEMHKRGIKLIMDLVVNHSSDEHLWFQESRKSKDNPYRDYYIWKKGRGRDGKKPPNNWTSRFTGSAWEYDELTKEWYLHLFSKKQPDLNWDNPKVREEIIDICNYWFELGVDGFRCDVITYVSKNAGYPNGRFNLIMRGDEHFTLGNNIHTYLKEINRKSWSKYDTMIVGEAIGTTYENAVSLIDEGVSELDSVITFELMEVDMKMNVLPVKLKLPKFKNVIEKWQSLPDTAWNSLYLENHDQPRSVSRYGNDKGRYLNKLAKMLSIMQGFLKGTMYIYQGQEIGMTNCELKENEYQDIMATQIFSLIRKIFPPLMPFARYIMSRRARDHARTPMQWNNEVNAGFTGGKPWMKINPNYNSINVKSQLEDNDSVLNFYKKIISIRNNNDIIIKGNFKQYYPHDKSIFMYERCLDNNKYIVICNFKEKDISVKVPDELKSDNYTLIVSNYNDTPDMHIINKLRPYEAVVYKI